MNDDRSEILELLKAQDNPKPKDDLDFGFGMYKNFFFCNGCHTLFHPSHFETKPAICYYCEPKEKLVKVTSQRQLNLHFRKEANK